MSTSEHIPLAACPACIAMPDTRPNLRAGKDDIVFSVPEMHCAACISKIESMLNARPDVKQARVNLSRKRVTIKGEALDADVLKDAISAIGYQAYTLDSARLQDGATSVRKEWLIRLGVAGFAMMNVMLLSISVWTGAEDATRDFLHWISAFIAIPATLFAAQPFFKNAWRALRVGQLTMDVPIALAILLALVMSLYETATHGEHAYFDAALSLTFFLLAGRYLDYETRASVRSAAAELAALQSPEAYLVKDGDVSLVALKDVSINDMIRVYPGERVPVDGVVVAGQSDLDQSILTGETASIEVFEGEFVYAGAMNLTGVIDVKTTAVGEDSSLQKVAQLVDIAESAKTKYSSLADRAAKIYAPLVHILALVAFIAWITLRGDWHFAMNVAIAVLIITCPCALGLAVPAVNTVASGRLFKNAVLLKSETALERLADIDCVVFDKTGTLTTGNAKLLTIEGVDNLRAALTLARLSHHPLAKSLAVALEARGIEPLDHESMTEIPGQGVEAVVNGARYRLGRASWFGKMAGATPEIYLEANGEYTHFTFEDEPRAGADELISYLNGKNIPVFLLSGDTKIPVANFAQSLGIDEYYAEMRPEAKAAFVEALVEAGKKPLMVGDGLNDTAALATAYVSMSPGSALDATQMASDIVLLSPSLSSVEETLVVAKQAKSRILENFALSAGYNLIAVPVALLGFATPLLAALAMSLSSITVLMNSNRLRGKWWRKGAAS